MKYARLDDTPREPTASRDRERAWQRHVRTTTPRAPTPDRSPEGRPGVHGPLRPVALTLLAITLAIIGATSIAMALLVSVWTGALFLVLGVLFAVLANPVAWATLLRIHEQP
ncbi:MAG: hypothetical protein R3B49_01865 [Phycisphaerales bacterium]